MSPLHHAKETSQRLFSFVEIQLVRTKGQRSVALLLADLNWFRQTFVPCAEPVWYPTSLGEKVLVRA